MSKLKIAVAGFSISLTLAAFGAFVYVREFWATMPHWYVVSFVVFIMYVGFALPAKVTILIARKALKGEEG